MLEAGEEERVQEEFPPIAPQPAQEQSPEQEPQPQITHEETVDFLPYDEETNVFYCSPVEELTSDEESSSPSSMGNDYEFNNALYAALDDDDVGYQNQYASSNHEDVPEALDCDDADYLSSNGTYESELEYVDLDSLTPTASQFNNMIYGAHADKDESSYEFNNTLNNTNNPLECTQNNVAVINSFNVAPISTAIPSIFISASTNLTSGNSLSTTNSSTSLPNATPNVTSANDEDKENKPSYSSRLKSKHGRSFNGADISENASKQRKLVGSLSVNDSNATKDKKTQGITSRRGTGLASLDNQSIHRARKSPDAASRATTRTNALQDIENQPVYKVSLTPNVQKQLSIQQYPSKTPSKEASIVTAASAPVIQQTTSRDSTATTPKYTTVSVLGKKRTRHERDEYDFYSDYHRPEAKKLFNELLSKDPF